MKPGADADDERRENRRGDPTIDVDVGTLCEWIKFVVKNMFCQYGNAVYHQIFGFLMGANCGVELADTYLFSYEYAYLLRQLRLLPGIVSLPLQLVVVLYSKRYIDDILSLDLDGFETGDVFYDDRGTGGTDGIYPRSLSGPNGLIDFVVNTIRLASLMIDNGYKPLELFSEIRRFSAFSPWKGKWSHVLMKILRSLRRRAHSSSA